jgi:hypothetical protein
MPEFVGTGFPIVKVRAFDASPPGFAAVTSAVPGVAMSVAGMAALSRIADTNVVGRSDPFHRTTEPLMNPVPFTVRVNAVLPAAREVGLMLEIVPASACGVTMNTQTSANKTSAERPVNECHGELKRRRPRSH